VRDPIEAARAAAAFLSAETRLRVHAPSLVAERDAVVVPFESIAGKVHRIAFSIDFLASHDEEEIATALRENWVPDHMRHADYQTLLVTADGIENYEA
jgi:hypothetical protein